MNIAAVSLAAVAQINPRFDRASLDDPLEAATFVPMAHVSEESGAIVGEDSRPIGEVLKGFTPFVNRDVLVAKITPCFENGKIAHARISRRVGFGSTEFHVVRPDLERLDDRYLFHFLRQPSIRIQGEKRMTGSGGQRRVPKAFLEGLQIHLPKLAEQRRIATILDKADVLRAKRREAIAKLDQLVQSVFLDMFGDPNVEDGDDLTPFSSIFIDVSAGHTKTKQEDYLKTGDLPIVDQGQALVGGYSDDLRSKSSAELPVIVFGDHTRCVKYVDFPFGVGADGTKILRPKFNDDPRFLYWWLKLRRIPSAGYSRHFKFLKEAKIRRPSLEKQRHFSGLATEVSERLMKIHLAQRSTEKLFLSIQSRAFSGML